MRDPAPLDCGRWRRSTGVELFQHLEGRKYVPPNPPCTSCRQLQAAPVEAAPRWTASTPQVAAYPHPPLTLSGETPVPDLAFASTTRIPPTYNSAATRTPQAMAGRFVRASKYREFLPARPPPVPEYLFGTGYSGPPLLTRSRPAGHVFGKSTRKDSCYDNLHISRNAWDTNLVKVGRVAFPNPGGSRGLTVRFAGQPRVPVGQLGCLRRWRLCCDTVERARQAARCDSPVPWAHGCRPRHRLVLLPATPSTIPIRTERMNG